MSPWVVFTSRLKSMEKKVSLLVYPTKPEIVLIHYVFMYTQMNLNLETK